MQSKGQVAVEYMSLIAATLMLVGVLSAIVFAYIHMGQHNLFEAYLRINMHKIIAAARTLWTTGTTGDTITLTLYFYQSPTGESYQLTCSDAGELYYLVPGALGDTQGREELSSAGSQLKFRMNKPLEIFAGNYTLTLRVNVTPQERVIEVICP